MGPGALEKAAVAWHGVASITWDAVVHGATERLETMTTSFGECAFKTVIPCTCMMYDLSLCLTRGRGGGVFLFSWYVSDSKASNVADISPHSKKPFVLTVKGRVDHSCSSLTSKPCQVVSGQTGRLDLNRAP